MTAPLELYPAPDNPLPDHALCLGLATADGQLLRAMRAVPPDARGTVVILGGRGDYMERYFETMRNLMARGFAVASFDFRGQGGSGRPLRNRYRGHIRSFTQYDEDLRTAMDQMVLPFCPGPYFAIGHSTGGNILIRALRRQGWFSRAVALAPLIDLNYGNWPRPVAAVLVLLATWSGLGWMFLPGQRHIPMGKEDFPHNPLTSDQGRWRRDTEVLDRAPHLGIGAPTFSWLRAARKSTAALRAMGRRDRLKSPLLIVTAGLDRVVSRAAQRRFAEAVPGVALVEIAESQHEILGERDQIRDQFFAVFEAFLAQPAQSPATLGSTSETARSSAPALAGFSSAGN